jgi:hypothetical protein
MKKPGKNSMKAIWRILRCTSGNTPKMLIIFWDAGKAKASALQVTSDGVDYVAPFPLLCGE